MRWAGIAALVALGAGGYVVTKLPRPRFPAPVASVQAPTHMRIVSSRYHAPGGGGTVGPRMRSIPRSFRGASLQRVVLFAPLIALYGRDGASARYLLSFDPTGQFRYGFDFARYVWPPRIRQGEREFVYEEVVWAREADGVLYVENAHSTYARSSYGRNAYVTAIDLHTKKVLWRSPALVANAKTFVLTVRYLVTGYGFTKERDYLYLLDRRTGAVVERIEVPSAPDRLTLLGTSLRVRTYDHDLVVQLRGV